MKATLREKKIKNGKKSLYLDFYPPILHPETGKHTRREFLGLYLYEKPKSELERTHNRETKILAQTVCAKRQIALQEGHYGFLSKNIEQESFLHYFKDKVDKRQRTGVNYQSWKSTYLYLFRFSDGKLIFKNTTELFCKEFKEYLLNTSQLNSKRPLSHNAASAYFNIFKEATRQAFEDKYLKSNPARRVKSIPSKETDREFLTLEELKAMAKTECEDTLLKRAGLFSALTGLRWSDVSALVWSEVQHSDLNGYYIRFRTKKTNRPETLPINDNARDILGNEGDPDEKVFDGLKYGNNVTAMLSHWALKAGVNKRITFHSFRHTYATLQLTMGTDIYTVSKMLGHKKVETTQIYAKVINKRKREAANRIPKIDFD